MAELPERKRETVTLEHTLKQQLSSLRQLQPMFSRLQDLDGSIVPAAQRKAEVGLHLCIPSSCAQWLRRSCRRQD